MPNRNGVEKHAKRREIERQIVSGKSHREIGEAFGLSLDTIWRHCEKMKNNRELWEEVVLEVREAQQAKLAGLGRDDAIDIAAAYNKLAERVGKMLDQAERDDQPGLALAAADNLRKTLKDIATLQGKFAKSFNINISLAEQREWAQLRDILDHTFRRHPEAGKTFLTEVRKLRDRHQRIGHFVEVVRQ